MVIKKKILIVDDEQELVKLITFHMTIAGYDVLCAKNGIEALESAETEKPALIILDIMLPRLDGWEVCRRLRNNALTMQIPIIMLSALSEVNDKLKGFDLGIDDYMTKPFSPRELVVRVKRVLARSETGLQKCAIIRSGELEIDTQTFRVKRNAQEIVLTEKEKGILMVLVNNADKVLSHEAILDAVWGVDDIVEYGNIDVHISHLREKIEKDQSDPQFIKTIKGAGYVFVA